jgi:hypothetical protein
LRTSKKSRFFLANSLGFSEGTIGCLSALGYLPSKAELHFWPALIFISEQILEFIFLLSGSSLHLADLLLSIGAGIFQGGRE